MGALSKSDVPGVEKALRLLLFLALAMRLYGLTAFSLSNDELSALSRLQFDSLIDVLKFGVYPDYHPAGVQLFLFYWTGLFGFDEWVVRLPFAWMGVVSVYLVFRIGKSWFGEATGLLAAGSMAVLEFTLLYSQIARPYSPGLMFALLTVFYWSRFLGFENETNAENKNGGWTDAIGFSLSVSACMYTHYFAFIFAGIVCLSGLFFLNKRLLLRYFLCGLLIILLYLPGLDVFMHQLAKGGIGGPDGWLAAPGPDAFGSYLNYIFNDSFLLKLIFFISFTGLVLIYRGKIGFGNRHLLALGFFLLPIVIAYYYSRFVNPIFQFSILIFSFPFFLLFLFSFLPKGRLGITFRFVFFVILSAGFYSTVFEKEYYKARHFTEFRSVAKAIQSSVNTYGKDSVTVITNVHDSYYLNYYLDSNSVLKSQQVTRVYDEKERDSFNKAVGLANTPYLVYAYSNIYSPNEFDLTIRSRFPEVLQLDTFLNSGFRLYSRKLGDRGVQHMPDLVRELNPTSALALSLQDSIGDGVIKFDASKEFGASIQSTTLDLGVRKGCVFVGQATIENFDELEGIIIVISVEKGDVKYLYKGNDATLFRHGLKLPLRVSVIAELDSDVPPDAEVKLYIWNRDKKTFGLKDLILSIYRSRPNTFFPPM